MLLEVIGKVLHLPKIKAQALIDLIVLEKHRLVNYVGGVKQHSIQETLATQQDLLAFLYNFTQMAWFYGHDRSQFPIYTGGANKVNYIRIFSQLGLTQKLTYAIKTPPQFSVVLGSSVGQMRKRVNFLLQDLERGLLPLKHIIFGLGTNRPLDKFSVDAESSEKRQLLSNGIAPTEMNLLNKLMEKMIQKYNKKNKFQLSYWPIETISTATNRSNINCITTTDTIYSLDMVLKKEFSKSISSRKILFYSHQPYILRQQRDIEQVLVDDKIYCIGDAVDRRFFQQKKSMAIMLGEIARLIHQSYCQKDPSFTYKKLNASVKNELRALLQP